MYKVSVIIPVYQVEPYITTCMTSLLEQTLQEVEVLFVDDHGQDNSISLIRQFIQMHGLEAHWHILATPQNSGPALARNTGIHAAQGEFIAFVDGDDWVESTMYETLYQQAQLHQADISSSAAMLDYPDGQHRCMTNPRVGNGECSISMRKYLLRHYVSNFTTMLFRRDWLLHNHILFPDTKSSEDSCFMGCCYLLCRRIAQCDTPFYHYIIRTESISHRKHVYRGKEKRITFSFLHNFAKANGLWPTYHYELRWIYFKKAILSSILDFIKSYM